MSAYHYLSITSKNLLGYQFTLMFNFFGGFDLPQYFDSLNKFINTGGVLDTKLSFLICLSTVLYIFAFTATIDYNINEIR